MVRTGARGTGRPDQSAKHAVRHVPRRPRPRVRFRCGLLLLQALAGAVASAAAGEADLLPAGPAFFTTPGPGTFAASVEALPRPADLALVFFDPTSALPRGWEGLATEVLAVFRGLGVEASWRAGGTFGDSEVPEVPVILLPRDPLVSRRGVMGLVIRDQQPQRAVWIFRDAVSATLRSPSDGTNAADPFLLDRALARVAAHEIVHAVAPDAPHAPKGLMRHALSREFLTGAKAPIDRRCAASFVARLSLEWQHRLGRRRAEIPAAR